MIYDHRTYACRPGTLRKQLAMYEEWGLAAQVRHLGQPVLHAFTEVGDVNTFVHIWAYASMEERTRKRAAMQADPDWQEYLRRSAEAGMLVTQTTQILIRSPFMGGAAA